MQSPASCRRGSRSRENAILAVFASPSTKARGASRGNAGAPENAKRIPSFALRASVNEPSPDFMSQPPANAGLLPAETLTVPPESGPAAAQTALFLG